MVAIAMSIISSQSKCTLKQIDINLHIVNIILRNN